AFEQYKRERILNILSYIPGVLVEVNAELDETASKSTSSEKRDSKNPVAVRESTNEDNSTNTNNDGGGLPGPQANGPSANSLPPAPQRQNQDVQKSHKHDTALAR